MAEPISLIASVVSVAEASFQIAKSLSAIVEAYRNAPQELAYFAYSVKHTGVLLGCVAEIIKNDDDGIFKPRLSEVIRDIQWRYISINDALEKCVKGSRKIQKLLWLFRQRKVESLLQKLEGAKQSLSLVLEIVSLAKAQATGRKFEVALRNIQAAEAFHRSVQCAQRLVTTPPGLASPEDKKLIKYEESPLEMATWMSLTFSAPSVPVVDSKRDEKDLTLQKRQGRIAHVPQLPPRPEYSTKGTGVSFDAENFDTNALEKLNIRWDRRISDTGKHLVITDDRRLLDPYEIDMILDKSSMMQTKPQQKWTINRTPFMMGLPPNLIVKRLLQEWTELEKADVDACIGISSAKGDGAEVETSDEDKEPEQQAESSSRANKGPKKRNSDFWPNEAGPSVSWANNPAVGYGRPPDGDTRAWTLFDSEEPNMTTEPQQMHFSVPHLKRRFEAPEFQGEKEQVHSGRDTAPIQRHPGHRRRRQSTMPVTDPPEAPEPPEKPKKESTPMDLSNKFEQELKAKYESAMAGFREENAEIMSELEKAKDEVASLRQKGEEDRKKLKEKDVQTMKHLEEAVRDAIIAHAREENVKRRKILDEARIDAVEQYKRQQAEEKQLLGFIEKLQDEKVSEAVGDVNHRWWLAEAEAKFKKEEERLQLVLREQAAVSYVDQFRVYDGDEREPNLLTMDSDRLRLGLPQVQQDIGPLGLPNHVNGAPSSPVDHRELLGPPNEHVNRYERSEKSDLGSTAGQNLEHEGIYFVPDAPQPALDEDYHSSESLTDGGYFEDNRIDVPTSRPWKGLHHLGLFPQSSVMPLYIRGTKHGQTWFLGDEVVYILEFSETYRETVLHDETMNAQDYLIIHKLWIDNKALESSGFEYNESSDGTYFLLDPRLTWVSVTIGNGRIQKRS
ncbi:hypothetical protein F5Y15DRAFT_288733 [Xylariaceae sp. FL0016]|nr:hypothetical protein F5Y15DRAFT_288733 [Xylariaceae sp. FL0016]